MRKETIIVLGLIFAVGILLAREAYLDGLSSLSAKYQMDLPKGASEGVIEAGRKFVARHGKGKLKEVAKLHFVTTQQVLG